MAEIAANRVGRSGRMEASSIQPHREMALDSRLGTSIATSAVNLIVGFKLRQIRMFVSDLLAADELIWR
ncbi:MAG: hypothetical protein ACREDP_14730 [Bradyrhizobium sp.]